MSGVATDEMCLSTTVPSGRRGLRGTLYANHQSRGDRRASGRLNSVSFGGFYSPPLMNFDQKLALTGPLIDAAKSMARHYELRPVFVSLSQAQLNDFPASHIDIGLGIFKTRQRERLGEFSLPLFRFGLQGLSLHRLSVCSFNDPGANELTCAVKEGDIGHEFLVKTYGSQWVRDHCVIVPAESNCTLRQVLLDHKCDVVLCDTLTVRNWKREITQDTWLLFERPPLDVEMCFLVSPDSPISVGAVNEWLRLKRTSGKLSSLMGLCGEQDDHIMTHCL